MNAVEQVRENGRKEVEAYLSDPKNKSRRAAMPVRQAVKQLKEHEFGKLADADAAIRGSIKELVEVVKQKNPMTEDDEQLLWAILWFGCGGKLPLETLGAAADLLLFYDDDNRKKLRPAFPGICSAY